MGSHCGRQSGFGGWLKTGPQSKANSALSHSSFCRHPPHQPAPDRSGWNPASSAASSACSIQESTEGAILITASGPAAITARQSTAATAVRSASAGPAASCARAGVQQEMSWAPGACKPASSGGLLIQVQHHPP